MNTPAPKGAGEGWFPLGTLPADIYPQVSKALTSSRLHRSHRILQGKTVLGVAESQGTHPLRPDLHFAQMGECHFKVWIPQHQKHNCSSPGYNLWEAANTNQKKKKKKQPQIQPAFDSNWQKNISLRVSLACRLAESGRSLSPQDAHTGIMSSRLSHLGMIRATELSEGRSYL